MEAHSSRRPLLGRVSTPHGTRPNALFAPGCALQHSDWCPPRRALKSRHVSALKEAAAQALGIPVALVERSAAARAAESDSDVDTILSAWAGGESAPAAPPTTSAEPETSPQPQPEAAEPAIEEEPAPVSVAVVDQPEAVVPPAPVFAPEPEEPLEPVPLATRVRTAVKVGSWTGAALGLIGFFMASSAWAPNAAVLEDSGPIVQVESQGVLMGVALVSIVFGAVVASLSRAAAGWRNPAMQLAGRKAATAWIGAATGLVLGLIGGAVLAGGFGTPIEGAEGMIQLPVLATLAVLLIGGAILGALTAAIPQLLGTPVALGEGSEEEVEAVKRRLGGAMSIPMAAAVILVLLVIPFGYTLVQSNHLGANGAAIVAILTAGGILGFASLAGSRPQMRISFGELLVAVAGIGVVLVIIIAVLFYSGQDEHPEEGGEEAVVVALI